MKFGGALMSDAPGIRMVGEIIKNYCNDPLVVVVSALGKTTNALERLHSTTQANTDVKEDFEDLVRYHTGILKDLNLPDEQHLLNKLDEIFASLYSTLSITFNNRYEAYDSIVSYGEELSSCIVFNYLQSNGIVVSLSDSKKTIITDENFTDASVNWESTSRYINAEIAPEIESGRVVITQGFTGGSLAGKPTTLGREGSDFTAAIFANVLNADEVTIWKNVPGLMNADPARFNDAVKIDNISYHEAIELAYYGASVIHPKTIQPLKQKKIPLFVRSYQDLDMKPTTISDNSGGDGLVPGIIVKDNQVLLSVSTRNLSFIAEENLKQIFDAFSRNKIHINMMQNSAVSFSVCFNEDSVKMQSLISDLRDIFILKYNTGLQLLTVRHYNDSLIDKLVGSSEVLLVQKSRVTVQILVKGN